MGSLASCRTLPERQLAPDDPGALAVLDRWKLETGAHRGLRGRARLAVDSDDDGVSVRSKQVLVAQRPARLRVEILGFLNQALAVVVTDGDRYEVLRAEDRSYESGPLRQTLLWDEAGIALTPHEAISVLLGGPLPDPDWRPTRIAVDSAGRTAIHLSDADALPRQMLVFGPDGRLVELRWYHDGRLIWRAGYDDYREIGTSWLAHRIALDVAIGTTHAEITLRDVELNPELAIDIFRLGPPAEAMGDGRAPERGPVEPREWENG